jgi:penicillin-binding protein 2
MTTRPPSVPSGGPQINPDLARRLAILGAIVLAALGLLLLRLWFLQVIGGANFEQAATENRIREVAIDAPRGVIRDRNGTQLVRNRVAQNVVIHPQELPEAHRARVLEQLARNLKTTPAALEKILVKGEEASGVEPVAMAEDVGPMVQAYVAERRRQLPGVALERSYVREYPEGSTAAHILGYVQPIPEESLDTYLNRGYLRDEKVGVAGLERQYERYLRGQTGTRRYEVDADGNITDRGDIALKPPRPGNDLRLSIDLPTQKALEDQLQARVKISGSSNAAAGIAIDPQTGEVLAMASYPTFTPDAFASRKEKLIAGYSANPNQVFLNRAIAGQYPAASTFKPITAIAALESGHLEADEFIASPAKVVLYGQSFSNFDDLFFGELALRRALMYSADTYFYNVADLFVKDKQRPEQLQQWATSFGLGAPTGIDLQGEGSGLVPTEAWKQEQEQFKGTFEEDWLPGDTIQMSIGQKLLLATPLQMAVAYSAIANDGKVVTPTLVRAVENQGGSRVLDRSRGRRVRPLGASKASIDAVKDGLYLVANDFDGTASGVFQLLPEAVKAAGKTGTAEVTRNGVAAPDHSWFVGYAPFAPDPEIVVAIVVENGGTGANAAAPAVCQVMAVNLEFDRGLCGSGAKAN